MTQEELLASDKNLLYQCEGFTGLDGLHWVRINSTWYCQHTKNKYEVEPNINAYAHEQWFFQELTTEQLVEVTLKQLLQ